MNIMLVSVTERTREIGLKKAIGARKNRILAQFLTEAAVLTSLGGIIGTITGIALAEIIGKISNVPIAISIPAVILAIAFSTVIGVVFGLLPAVKAANLDPIVALRHEQCYDTKAKKQISVIEKSFVRIYGQRIWF